jgi:hypothetical protein
MKLKGLDGEIYQLNCKQSDVSDDNRSGGHLKCRSLIKQIFPYDVVLEEIVLPGTYNLRADFFLPLRKCIMEVHGIQHYEYNMFFHKNLRDFRKGKIRDEQKLKFCQLNNIIYLELDYRKQDGWAERIKYFYKYGLGDAEQEVE